jgi:hypothetical protein
VQLEAWRTFYDHDRPHGSLSGSTPAERVAELATKIPAPEAIQAAYDPSREFIRSQTTSYRWLPTMRVSPDQHRPYITPMFAVGTRGGRACPPAAALCRCAGRLPSP